MPLNKQKGNMYPWVTHTWNPIKGKCPHDCIYCYMKLFKVGPLRLDEKEFKTNLGKGNVIFVGSSCDMWAWLIPDEWIHKTLEHCRRYPKNRYLFQSKSPSRFRNFISEFHKLNCILGTTLETNRLYRISRAELPLSRAASLSHLDVRKMVSIEPVMDFDLKEMVTLIESINPEFVSIGANSKERISKLEEPSKEKVEKLVKELKRFTEVKLKSNLRRLGIRP